MVFTISKRAANLKSKLVPASFASLMSKKGFVSVFLRTWLSIFEELPKTTGRCSLGFLPTFTMYGALLCGSQNNLSAG
ncbi:hypothetical protein Hdeb2414_s0024g00653861 [Helianthus debilis subsp. tardiflorus]